MTRSPDSTASTPEFTATAAPPGPAPGAPSDANAWAGYLAIAALIAVYAPILRAMVEHWGAVDDYSHGFLIVPLAVFFAYQRKYDLQRVAIEGSWLGVIPLFLGALSLAVGRLGVELMSMRVGFVLSLIGLVLLLFGKRITRVLAFPLCFLFLMVPLPQSLVNSVTFPLQLIAANMAVESLHLLSIPALLEGNVIHLAKGDLFVAEACSGLRSVMALLTLGVVFAYFFARSWPRRIVLILSTLPIAILVNGFRVALTSAIAHYYGTDVATGGLHDFQGLITFGLAMLVLSFLARALEFASWRWAQRRRGVGA